MAETQPHAAHGGVIHDLGYRTYDGPRLSTRWVARSLFLTGLQHAFGIGRSGKAKVLPLGLLALSLLPAVIIVAIMVVSGFGGNFVDYSTYSGSTFVLIVVFTAGQAPVLFTRDLRSGSIVLYLARPLSPTGFAMVRWGCLVSAIFTFTVVPVLLLYVGALAAEADAGEQTVDLLQAIAGLLVLAAVLATISGLLSAYTLRRGLAVGAVIVALLVSNGFVSAVKAIAATQGNDPLGQWIGLLSPFTLVDGLNASLLGGTGFYPLGPDSTTMTAAYAATVAFVLVAGLWLLIRRYHRQGTR
jgi:ABC-2 type transport system permease protein